jgi:prepilin-type N-terminal cleavage/methylation domain-containing protein
MAKAKFKSSPGFTLIEMAIVLVVIGLILGMVYKGKQLVDQSRAKRLVANRNKIIAAVNTFYDRYGFYPGDGCNTATPSSPSECTREKDNIIKNGYGGYPYPENEAFWYLLIHATKIMDENTRSSIFGQDWIIKWEELDGGWDTTNSPDGVGSLELPGNPRADPRILCAADKMVDDGSSTGGNIREEDNRTPYDENTDCWNLSGQVDVRLQIIP